MISPRYAAAVLLLAGLALVPTVIHSYARLVVDDGVRTATVPTSLAGLTGTASTRNTTWGKRRFDSDDWMERKYTGAGREVTLTVIRSYDSKALYHHPELAVAYHEGHTFGPEQIVRYPQNPAVPVHLLRAVDGDRAASMYVLFYDGTYVDNPIAFQVRSALQLLFSGRKPMTLFFAQDAHAPEDLSNAAVTSVLLSAVSTFGAPAH